MEARSVHQVVDTGPETHARSALIPLLQRVQARDGYVSQEAVAALSRMLRVPAAEIFGVLTFYAQFRLKPIGRHVVKVCRGTACHVRGAPLVLGAIEAELGLDGPEDTTPDGEFTLERIACFGACSLAPVVVIDGDTIGHIDPDKARRLLRKLHRGSPSPAAEQAEASDD